MPTTNNCFDFLDLQTTMHMYHWQEGKRITKSCISGPNNNKAFPLIHVRQQKLSYRYEFYRTTHLYNNVSIWMHNLDDGDSSKKCCRRMKIALKYEQYNYQCEEYYMEYYYVNCGWLFSRRRCFRSYVNSRLVASIRHLYFIYIIMKKLTSLINKLLLILKV